MLLAPGRTFCGSIRFGAVRSSQAISPWRFSAEPVLELICARRHGGAGETAVVKSQFERPSSDDFLHCRPDCANLN